MSDAKFSCEGCGKTYKWKPEFAGKKVKCKCGFVMTAPAAPAVEPPADDEPDLDALYSLADDGKQAAKAGAAAPAGIRCPSCKTDLEPGAVICFNCGFNLKSGGRAAPAKAAGAPVMAGGGGAAIAVAGGRPAGAASPLQGFPAPRRGLQQEKGIEENSVQDLYAPLGLLAFGLIASIVQMMFFDPVLIGFVPAVITTLLATFVEVLVLGVAFLAAIKMMDVALGSPGTALLKLAAVAIAPGAVAKMLAFLINDSSGFVTWAVQMIVWIILFKYLFDLDLGEILMLSAIVFFARFIVGAFILGAILGLLGMGASLPDIGGGGKADLNDDRIVLDLQNTRVSDDAMSWMKDNTNRMYGEAGHSASVKLVEDLTALGCTKFDLLSMKGEGSSSTMFAKLPKDKAKRKEAFDVYNKFAKQFKIKEVKDKGQSYLLMNYSVDFDLDESDTGTKDAKPGKSDAADEDSGARAWPVIDQPALLAA